METQQNIEKYRNLYLGGSDNEQNFHYDFFVELYLGYLNYFANKENGYEDVYQNQDFLRTVVEGFDYYQRLFFHTDYDDGKSFGEEDTYDVTLENLQEHMLSMSLETQMGVQPEDPIANQIYSLSHLCATTMMNQSRSSLEISSDPLIAKLYMNSCRIENTINKYSRGCKGM